MPPSATTSGSASRRRSRSSPRSNSRRASSPATRKKNAISPEFTQPRQLSARPLVPDRITSTVCQVAAYPAGSIFAQASAASVAASRTAALPVSVRRNRRSGVSKCSAHTVRSEHGDTAAAGSVTSGIVSRSAPAHDLRGGAQPPWWSATIDRDSVTSPTARCHPGCFDCENRARASLWLALAWCLRGNWPAAGPTCGRLAMIRRDALSEYVRGSLWVLPTMSVLAALAAGSLLSLVRVGPRSPLAFQGTSDDARTLLIGIAGTMVTVIALLLGLTVVALQLSSTQYSPRLLRNFLRDRPNQVVLSVFVATFAYSAAGLYTVGVSGGSRTATFPRLAVSGALVLLFVSLGLLVYFADHLVHPTRVDAIRRGADRAPRGMTGGGLLTAGKAARVAPEGGGKLT